MSRSSDRRITIRLKPEEYALLQAKAGSKPVGTYVRETVLAQSAQKRSGNFNRVEPNQSLAAKVLALLGPHTRIAEFKHAAKRIDDGIVPADDETKQLLIETRDWLARLHALLLQTLRIKSQ